MAVRKGDCKHAVELLAEFLIGRGYISKDAMIKAGAAKVCGYDENRDNLGNTVHSALNMLRIEKVVVVKHVPATSGFPSRPPHLIYKINPELEGMVCGRAMREKMAILNATSPLDKVRSGAEKPKVAGNWGSIFDAMSKQKQLA